MSLTDSCAHSPRVPRATQLRIGLPQTGESISSCLDRAASLWNLPRQALVFELTHLGRGAFGDPDVCRGTLSRESLAASMGASSDVIAHHAANPSRVDVLMSSAQRNAYCPLCFRDDLDAGLIPYFRLDWARFFLTHCPIHRSPLFDWEALSTVNDRRLPHAFYMGTSAHEVDLPWFASALERAAKYASGEWPEASRSKELWRGLVQFETSLMDEGLGDPRITPDEQGLRREVTVYNLMSLMMCMDLNSPNTSAAAQIRLAFDDSEVIGFTIRRYNTWATHMRHTKLQSSLRWLVCRRVALILAAQTLDELDAPLWLATGHLAPRGSSDAWIQQLKSTIPVKRRANRAARMIRKLHGAG
jgi:hypothetical protein